MTAKAKKYTKKTKTELPPLPTWVQLLHDAVHIPGLVAECYSLFHDYSPGNQMLAYWQCKIRNIEPGPIGTYKFWRDMGRVVTSGKGSGIYLCHPVSYTREEVDRETGEKHPVGHVAFKYSPHWFVLSQTTGPDVEFPELPGFDLGSALWGLEIEPVAFSMTDGNCMGYAQERSFAVNPLGKHQMATTIHELAHIVLGHTEESSFADTKDRTPRDIRELEAECTAMIVLDQLGEKDHAESRGYIQNWYKDNEVPEESARRIFTASDKILKAGRS